MRREWIVLLASFSIASASAVDTRYVIATSVNLREQPNTNAKVLATLPIATQVDVQKSDEQWGLVVVLSGDQKGERGWISSKYLEYEKPVVGMFIKRFDETPERDFVSRQMWAERALALDPSNSEATKRLASSYIGRGNARESDGDLAAIDDYTRAMELDPGLFETYRKRTADLLSIRAGEQSYRGRDAEAIVSITTAIELDRKNGSRYVHRGGLRSVVSDIVGAIADVDTGLELRKEEFSDNTRGFRLAPALQDKELAYIYFARGNMKRAHGDFDGARADFDRATVLDSNFQYAYFGKAVLLFAAQEYSAALTELHFSLNARVDPMWSAQNEFRDVAHLYVFLSRARIGARTEANRELERYFVGRKHLESDESDFGRAVIAYYLGRSSEESILKLARSIAWNQRLQRARECQAHFYVGMAKLLDDDKDAAAGYFRAAISTVSTMTVEYMLAKAYLNLLTKK